MELAVVVVIPIHERDAMDANPQAARIFYDLVRSFSAGVNATTRNAIYHQVSPDEVYDLARISYRVYGRWSEYLAVMAAANIDSPELAVTAPTLALPNDATLIEMKRAAGFESVSEYRENGAPTWEQSR